jgi:hypothetical protein
MSLTRFYNKRARAYSRIGQQPCTPPQTYADSYISAACLMCHHAISTGLSRLQYNVRCYRAVLDKIERLSR